MDKAVIRRPGTVDKAVIRRPVTVDKAVIRRPVTVDKGTSSSSFEQRLNMLLIFNFCKSKYFPTQIARKPSSLCYVLHI